MGEEECRVTISECGVFFWAKKNVLLELMIVQHMNALNVTKLYTLKWLTLGYVNFTSIKRKGSFWLVYREKTEAKNLGR